jgi:hypothetical protein
VKREYGCLAGVAAGAVASKLTEAVRRLQPPGLTREVLYVEAAIATCGWLLAWRGKSEAWRGFGECFGAVGTGLAAYRWMLWQDRPVGF